MTGTLFGLASGFEGASGSKESSSLELDHSTRSNEDTTSGFDSIGATIPDVPAHHASCDEANSSESLSAPQHEVPAPVPDKTNWWCIHGQY